jgi:hypothetical protein
MMSEEKTHYRKAFNSPYLSSADIVEPTILNIKYVQLRIDDTKKSKDYFNTAFFVESEIRPGEKLKPMILNATNSRTLKDITGSHFIEDWQNVPVTVYVDHNVRFGRDSVEGLRISQAAPQEMRKVLTPESGDAWLRAVAAYSRDGDLAAVLAHVDISSEHQTMIMELANVAQH